MSFQLINTIPAFRISLQSSTEDLTDPRRVNSWKLNRHEDLNYVKISYTLKYFKYSTLDCIFLNMSGVCEELKDAGHRYLRF
jgi:hypothetical protein